MKLFRKLLFVSLLFCFGTAHAGKGFTQLDPAQPTESGKKIEVIEFFYYGCPHCYDLQKYLEAWLKKMPADVQFRYQPTAFDDNWARLARTYYALDALGLEPKWHEAVYEAVQNQNIDLGDEKNFVKWVAGRGIDAGKATAAWNAFSTQVAVSRAREITKSYGIDGTPSLIVDGKYLTSPGITQSLPGTITVLDQLIARARAERAHSR